MEKTKNTARISDAEMVSDEENPKQDVALLEAHGKTCLLTGTVQGGTFRQDPDTRDETPLWTRHNPRDGEGLEDKAQYNEWQIGYPVAAPGHQGSQVISRSLRS